VKRRHSAERLEWFETREATPDSLEETLDELKRRHAKETLAWYEKRERDQLSID